MPLIETLITAAGETKNASQWARAAGVTLQSLTSRIKRGWCVECAVTANKGGNCPHTGPAPKNLSPLFAGMKIGRLTLVRFISERARSRWECICECGTVGTHTGSQLRHRRSLSCGCLRKEVSALRLMVHGERRGNRPTPELAAYFNAKRRCSSPKVHNYRHYGGRGITFRFTAFEEFLAEVGRRPSPRHSLDRIDNDGHYEKGNVRWATPSEQARNRRKPQARSAAC